MTILFMSNLFSADFIVICGVPGIVGAIIGSYKKIGALNGFLLGFLLNIIGVIILIFLPGKDVYKAIYFSESIPDQLKKYKELLDSGVITEDEYNTQKSNLLNRPPGVY